MNARRPLPLTFALLALLLSGALLGAVPALAASVSPGGAITVALAYTGIPNGGSNWAVSGASSGTSASPNGFTVSSFSGSQSSPGSVTVGIPSSAGGGNYTVIIQSESTASFGTYTGSFAVVPVSSSPCTSSYPSTVSMYLADAPSPCQYFAATQGFNKSSAPLLLAVLGVLALILAIWLGHSTIMSVFRRLVAGMTGGN